MRKRLIILTFSILVISLCGLSAHAAEANPVVRVALAYGSSALERANLSYENGVGYNIGYYDSSDNFVTLHTIYDKRITVLKSVEYSYSGRVFAQGEGAAGIYHAEANSSFSDIGQALELLLTAKSVNSSAYLAYIGGSYRVRTGNYVSQGAALSNTSAFEELTGRGAGVAALQNSFRIVNTDTGEVLFEFSNNGSALGIIPFTDDGTVASAWHRNEIYPGGFRFSYASNGNLAVVNILPVQEYIKGVVPYEISPNWHIEAQKAQALCAKNYAVANINRHRSDDFDLCNDIHCQVYRGIRQATALSNSAVEAIFGQYITYNGEIISAFYHASNGGYTESSKNIWGTEVPYLQPVKDDYENTDTIPNGIWRKEITASEITRILRDKGVSTSDIVEVYVETFTPAGNVYKLTFIDSAGKPLSYTGEKARTILGSYTISQRYTISGSSSGIFVYGGSLSGGFANTYAIGADSTVQRIAQQASQITVMTSGGKKTGLDAASGSKGLFVIEGRGNGHNVGMSQYGAKGMAEAGFTYDQIITHYFTGVIITNVN